MFAIAGHYQMKAIRQLTKKRLFYQDVAHETLSPSADDFLSIQKVACMVGEEIAEVVFFGCLESVKKNEPEKPVAYFFGALKRQVPGLYEAMNQVFVRSS